MSRNRRTRPGGDVPSVFEEDVPTTTKRQGAKLVTWLTKALASVQSMLVKKGLRLMCVVWVVVWLRTKMGMCRAAQRGEIHAWYYSGGVDKACDPRTGATAAHVAAIYGHVETLRSLYECGFDLTRRTRGGLNPAMAAALQGEGDAAEFLVSGNLVDFKDWPLLAVLGARMGRATILLAAHSNGVDHSTVAHMVDGGDGLRVFRTPACAAAEAGHFNAVQTLASIGVSFDVAVTEYDLDDGLDNLNDLIRGDPFVAERYTRAEAETCFLMTSAADESTDESRTTTARKKDTSSSSSFKGGGGKRPEDRGRRKDHATVLFQERKDDRAFAVLEEEEEKNADIWHRRRRRLWCSPLWLAAANGHHEVVAELASAGVNWNVDPASKNPVNGWTAARVAVERNDLAVLNALARHAPRRAFDGLDVDGLAPAHRAAILGRKRALWLLAKRGVDLEIRTATYAARSTTRRPGDFFAQPTTHAHPLTTTQDDEKSHSGGATPAHFAAKFGNLKCLAVLAAAGVDLDATDQTGMTPLAWAAARGHDDVAFFLAASGADLNRGTDSRGLGPAHLAAVLGHDKVLDAVARVDPRTLAVPAPFFHGYSPTHLAADHGRLAVLRTIACTDGALLTLRTNDEDPSSSSSRGEAPADVAKRRGRFDVLEVLASAGVDVADAVADAVDATSVPPSDTTLAAFSETHPHGLLSNHWEARLAARRTPPFAPPSYEDEEVVPPPPPTKKNVSSKLACPRRRTSYPPARQVIADAIGSSSDDDRRDTEQGDDDGRETTPPNDDWEKSLSQEGDHEAAPDERLVVLARYFLERDSLWRLLCLYQVAVIILLAFVDVRDVFRRGLRWVKEGDDHRVALKTPQQQEDGTTFAPQEGDAASSASSEFSKKAPPPPRGPKDRQRGSFPAPGAHERPTNGSSSARSSSSTRRHQQQQQQQQHHQGEQLRSEFALREAKLRGERDVLVGRLDEAEQLLESSRRAQKASADAARVAEDLAADAEARAAELTTKCSQLDAFVAERATLERDLARLRERGDRPPNLEAIARLDVGQLSESTLAQMEAALPRLQLAVTREVLKREMDDRSNERSSQDERPDSGAAPPGLDVNQECIVCLAEPRSVAFNCGHLCVCSGCAYNVDACPICRVPVLERRRIFRS